MAISIQDSLKPIQAGATLPLVRATRPAQFALGFSELEWLGYKAWYREGVARGQLVPETMEQQGAAQCSSDAECSKKGPDASTPGP